jgi:hypothetical protein
MIVPVTLCSLRSHGAVDWDAFMLLEASPCRKMIYSESSR